MVQELLFIRLQKVSTWSVFLNKARIPSFVPANAIGKTGTDHDSAQYGASSYTALRLAFAWDSHPKVRTWRQHRYQLARSAGLPPAEAYWQSVPFVRQGYFDDGQFAIAACLLLLLVESLLELVNLVGVGLSYTKMVISFQDDQSSPSVFLQPVPLLHETPHRLTIWNSPPVQVMLLSWVRIYDLVRVLFLRPRLELSILSRKLMLFWLKLNPATCV